MMCLFYDAEFGKLESLIVTCFNMICGFIRMLRLSNLSIFHQNRVVDRAVAKRRIGGSMRKVEEN